MFFSETFHYFKAKIASLLSKFFLREKFLICESSLCRKSSFTPNRCFSTCPGFSHVCPGMLSPQEETFVPIIFRTLLAYSSISKIC
jgi:hypothetical protein